MSEVALQGETRGRIARGDAPALVGGRAGLRLTRRVGSRLAWLVVLLAFAGFFVVPVVWLLLAPTKTDHPVGRWEVTRAKHYGATEVLFCVPLGHHAKTEDGSRAKTPRRKGNADWEGER